VAAERREGTRPVMSPGRQVRNPLSLIRVDSAVARSAAGFGLAFLAQSIPPMLSQLPNMHPVWTFFLVGTLLLTLLAACVASAVRRYVRIVNSAFAIAYLVAMVSWPFAVLDVSEVTTASSWLYNLMTIATAMAAIGFEVRLAAVYLVTIPTIYAVIRLTPDGGDVGIARAALDSVYALILGGVITIIFTMLRTAAAEVDRAQQMALERYSHAVRQHATEAERVQVDAIVHDSVLTTLLSAARAYGNESKALAATMAGNAIGYLRDAVSVAPDVEAAVPGMVVATRIADSASAMAEPFDVRSDSAAMTSVPLPVAEAIFSAAVQAMVNSSQHGGSGVERWVEVRALAGDGIEVEVGDDGRGFNPMTVPTERLGVRVSIIERVASAGGHADIVTAPGQGTVITLRWPDARSHAAPDYETIAADAVEAEPS
jgi:signal transduction histidine kinase